MLLQHLRNRAISRAARAVQAGDELLAAYLSRTAARTERAAIKRGRPLPPWTLPVRSCRFREVRRG